MKNGKDDQVARVRAIVNRAFAAEPDRDILREQLLKDLDEELNRSTILSLSAAARELGVALNTLRHQIDAGTGPAVIQLSERRFGIARGELRRWVQHKIDAARATSSPK